MTNVAELRRRAGAIRTQVIELSHKAGTPHLGSSLSCIDVLTAAYWSALRIDPNDPQAVDRDRFILSKGHAALALYVTLCQRGYFDPAILQTYNCDGAVLAEQPSPGCVPGVEAATGSLGHGLSLGLGMALAGRLQGKSYRVFVLLSDGECNEGSVWEAALFAPAQRLDHVVAIVDYNKWQATGRSEEIMALKPLRQKWQAFGWSAHELDGHDLTALTRALGNVP